MLTTKRGFPKKKLAVALLSTSLSLLGAELVLRNFKVFDPFPHIAVGERESRRSSNSIVDEHVGWRLKPRHRFSWTTSEFQSIYASNGQGFRSERDFDAGEPRKKIIVAGDSFTFGVGVDYPDTFGALVESGLPGSVVYNLGMPGCGLDQIWLAIRHYGLPLKPDLVIVNLVDADFKRSQTAYRIQEGRNKPAFQLVDGRLIRETEDDRPSWPVRYLENHSRLWMGFKLAARGIGYTAPFGEWWRLNRAILDAIRADCRERETPVLLVYVPTKAWRPFPMLDSYMEETGARYVSLRSEAAPPPEEIYYAIDDHLNPAGHRYVAGVFIEWIRKNMPELEGETIP